MSIRQRRSGWQAIVYIGRDPAGRRKYISRMAATERAAKKLEVQLMREVDEGRRGDGNTATVSHLLDRWISHARIEESTRYKAASRLDLHVRPFIGRHKVGRLRPEDLDDLYRHLEKGDPRAQRKPLSPSYVRRIHADLRSAFKLAMRLGWIANNPVARAEPPPEPRSEPTAPDPEAVIAFLHALEHGVVRKTKGGHSEKQIPEPELALFVRLTAVTGMRRGEVTALRRSDIDIEIGAVRRARALGLAKGAPYVKGTKTGRRDSLAVDDETVDMLRLHLKRQDELAEYAGGSLVADPYVFTLDPAGATPWRPDYVTKRIGHLRGLVPGASGVTIQSLRRFMVTEGLEAGHSARAVAGRAGHARPSTTLDKYSARLPPSDRALAETMRERLSR